MECAGYMIKPITWEKLVQKPTHSKETQPDFSFCVGDFLGKRADWQVKRFRHNVTQSQIQLSSTEQAPAWGRAMGSTATGGWEKYHVTGEHTFL
jgi:hypothetical protein